MYNISTQVSADCDYKARSPAAILFFNGYDHWNKRLVLHESNLLLLNLCDRWPPSASALTQFDTLTTFKWTSLQWPFSLFSPTTFLVPRLYLSHSSSMKAWKPCHLFSPSQHTCNTLNEREKKHNSGREREREPTSKSHSLFRCYKCANFFHQKFESPTSNNPFLPLFNY